MLCYSTYELVAIFLSFGVFRMTCMAYSSYSFKAVPVCLCIFITMKYGTIIYNNMSFSLLPSLFIGQVGLGVGSWPSNRTTRDRLPGELDYTS